MHPCLRRLCRLRRVRRLRCLRLAHARLSAPARPLAGVHAVMLAGAALLASGPAAAQTVWRCTDAAGRVAFQQVPCAGTAAAARGVAVDATPRNVLPGRPEGDALARIHAERSAVVRSAMNQGRVVPGMTLAEARQVLGAPARVNQSLHGGGSLTLQLVYLYTDGTRWVHVTDGEVTSVDWFERPVASRPAPGPGADAAGNCPSPLDIGNMETSASSITLTPAQRRDWQQRIDLARRCREARG